MIWGYHYFRKHPYIGKYTSPIHGSYGKYMAPNTNVMIKEGSLSFLYSRHLFDPKAMSNETTK